MVPAGFSEGSTQAVERARLSRTVHLLRLLSKARGTLEDVDRTNAITTGSKDIAQSLERRHRFRVLGSECFRPDPKRALCQRQCFGRPALAICHQRTNERVVGGSQRGRAAAVVLAGDAQEGSRFGFSALVVALLDERGDAPEPCRSCSCRVGSGRTGHRPAREANGCNQALRHLRAPAAVRAAPSPPQVCAFGGVLAAAGGSYGGFDGAERGGSEFGVCCGRRAPCSSCSRWSTKRRNSPTASRWGLDCLERAEPSPHNGATTATTKTPHRSAALCRMPAATSAQ